MQTKIGTKKVTDVRANGKKVLGIRVGSKECYNAWQDFTISVDSVNNGYSLDHYNGSTGSVYIYPSESYKRITKLGFYRNSTITNISMPDTVIEIGDQCFFGNQQLSTITIPSSVTTIGEKVFNNDINLQEIVFEDGDSITSLGGSPSLGFENQVFRGCSSLAHINEYYGYTLVFPKINLLQLNYLYMGLPIEQIWFGAEMTQGVTGVGVCKNCTNLRLAWITATLIGLSASAFEGCYNLEGIDLNNTEYFTTFGSRCCYGCSSLTEIWVPTAVNNIGNYAFYNSGLKHIIYEAPENLSTWNAIRDAWNNISKGSNWENMSNGSIIEMYGYRAFFKKENGSWVWHPNEDPPSIN